MKSLYLRIWLTVVAALALFALVSGWMWQRHLEHERAQAEQAYRERLGDWAELVQRSLPAPQAPAASQAEALREWSARLRVPMALEDAQGARIAASDSYLRRENEGSLGQAISVRLDDGRTLWVARRLARRLEGGLPPPEATGALAPPTMPGRLSGPPPGLGALGPPGPRGPDHLDRPPPPALPLLPLPFGLPRALGPLVLVALLFVAVAAGAYPVVRRLTRRLEALKQGVAAFGAGDLGQRVDASGRDEVAEVAATFNRTAERIETLVHSHKSLLANASHELRSPLARLKMAVAMLGELPESQRARLVAEIHTNIAELDALVEEVLLASRLEGGAPMDLGEPVDLLGLAAEEAARVGAEVDFGAAEASGASGPAATAAPGGPAAGWVVPGSERLLRRAVRNLVENARRYGGDQVLVQVRPAPAGGLTLTVSDRGPGVPAEFRERIFDPYFRLPGHAEREGGVGLGLSLVRQIAQAHGGQVHCSARDGGGSVFTLALPARVGRG